MLNLIDATIDFEIDMFMQCYREAHFAELGKSGDEVLNRINGLSERISSKIGHVNRH